MTLKDEILELSVELNRRLFPDTQVITDLELKADVLRLLPLNVTVTQLTNHAVDVTREVNLDSDVNRYFLWELEL
jgi:hypothetical protein